MQVWISLSVTVYLSSTIPSLSTVAFSGSSKVMIGGVVSSVMFLVVVVFVLSALSVMVTL